MSGISISTIRADRHSIAIENAAGDALLIDASGHISINDGGNTITVDGTVTTNNSSAIAEDASVGDAHDVTLMGLVRQDTLASDTSADGDASYAKTSALGELYTKDTSAVALLGTIDIDTGNIAGSTSTTAGAIQTEDAASAGGESLMMIGGYRQDADTSPVSADGDFHGFIFNNLGELKVNSKLDSTLNGSLVVTNKTVDTTVGGVQLVAALSGRGEITLQNLGNKDVYIKDATGVTSGTSGNGFELASGGSATFNWGDSFDLFAITDSGTSVVKIIEAA